MNELLTDEARQSVFGSSAADLYAQHVQTWFGRSSDGAWRVVELETVGSTARLATELELASAAVLEASEPTWFTSGFAWPSLAYGTYNQQLGTVLSAHAHDLLVTRRYGETLFNAGTTLISGLRAEEGDPLYDVAVDGLSASTITRWLEAPPPLDSDAVEYLDALADGIGSVVYLDVTRTFMKPRLAALGEYLAYAWFLDHAADQAGITVPDDRRSYVLRDTWTLFLVDGAWRIAGSN